MLKANNPISVTRFPIKLLGDFSGSKTFIVYLTGDGGYNNFSEQLTEDMQKQGYPVIVFNTRKYFWDAKTPNQFISDLEEIVNYYLNEASIKAFAIVGYSFGADVGAFVPAMLSNELKEKLRPMVLMSPGLSTDFEIKIADMIGGSQVERKYKILPELDRTTIPIICLFGEDEELEIKAYLKESENIQVKIMSGGHRYNFDTEKLAQLIIQNIDPN